MDINNVFLHCDLVKDIYMCQPPSFTDLAKSDYTCKLWKTIYGLSNTDSQYSTLKAIFLAFRFVNLPTYNSLFVYQNANIPSIFGICG